MNVASRDSLYLNLSVSLESIACLGKNSRSIETGVFADTSTRPLKNMTAFVLFCIKTSVGQLRSANICLTLA